MAGNSNSNSNSNSNRNGNGNGRVPPGFRFHPTDEELVNYYLRKKVKMEAFDLDVIRDVDLNKLEPWDLHGMYVCMYVCIIIMSLFVMHMNMSQVKVKVTNQNESQNPDHPLVSYLVLSQSPSAWGRRERDNAYLPSKIILFFSIVIFCKCDNKRYTYKAYLQYSMRAMLNTFSHCVK